MRMNTLLIISILMLAVANAAMITVDKKHIFEGEEFAATYTANAPLSQQEVTVAFGKQIKKITLPTMAVGTFSTTISFTAPQAGDYEIVSGEAKTKVHVEPALLVLEDVSISPASIKPRESAKLSYTIENIGDARVYNVKSKITIPNSDKFNYNSDEQELFSVMAPGEKLVQTKDIFARENADSEANVQVVVSYEYGGEVHTSEKWVSLNAGSFDFGFALLAIVGVIILIMAKSVFSRAKHTNQ